MTHRLTTNYAKNYCNRTLIVKVIVENVVTCFFGGHGVDYIFYIDMVLMWSCKNKTHSRIWELNFRQIYLLKIILLTRLIACLVS